MVVHVDAFSGRVEVAVFKIEHRALAACDEAAERAVGYYVNVGKAAAVEVVGAFTLIGGGGSAPEEVCGNIVILLVCGGGCMVFALVGWTVLWRVLMVSIYYSTANRPLG